MRAGPFAIAGAGIGGLAAALALAEAGCDSVVLERAAQLSEVGAGLQLAPNATRRLARWSVDADCGGRALAPEAVDIFSGPGGARIASLSLRESERRWGAPYRVAHRADLLAALVAAASASPRIEIRTGEELRGWSEGDGLEIETSSGRFTAAALIGADGVRSRVRAALAFREGDAPVFSGALAWRALLPADALNARWRAPRTGLRMGPQAHMVHYPLRGASVLNVVAVTPGPLTPDEADGWDYAGDGATLAAAFLDWSDDARELVAAAPRWTRWPLFTRAPLERWSRGRVALLGDSAHAMAPFLAQGAAQAIEDADALGRAVAAQPGDIPAALAAYGAARAGRANRVQAASFRQGRVYHLSGPLALARDAAMRLMGANGLARANDWLYRA